MRPSAFTVSSRARSTSASLVTSHGDRDGLAAVVQFVGGLLGQRLVAIPDRDRRAGVEKPLDDRAADALRAAGDDGVAAGEIDLVGHVVSPLPGCELADCVRRTHSYITAP